MLRPYLDDETGHTSACPFRQCIAMSTVPQTLGLQCKLASALAHPAARCLNLFHVAVTLAPARRCLMHERHAAVQSRPSQIDSTARQMAWRNSKLAVHFRTCVV